MTVNSPLEAYMMDRYPGGAGRLLHDKAPAPAGEMISSALARVKLR